MKGTVENVTIPSPTDIKALLSKRNSHFRGKIMPFHLKNDFYQMNRHKIKDSMDILD